jgi:predicted DCC family thiol-disulfide oxidoreductase YuxK
MDVDRPVLLYDGACGLCTWTVRFVLRHERRRALRFASLQGDFAGRLHARHPELAGIDSVVWYEPAAPKRAERLLVRSDAVFAVLGYLGGWWRLGRAAQLVPRPWRDAVYALVARHRRRLSGADLCTPPPPAQRPRFLDP